MAWQTCGQQSTCFTAMLLPCYILAWSQTSWQASSHGDRKAVCVACCLHSKVIEDGNLAVKAEQCTVQHLCWADNLPNNLPMGALQCLGYIVVFAHVKNLQQLSNTTCYQMPWTVKSDQLQPWIAHCCLHCSLNSSTESGTSKQSKPCRIECSANITFRAQWQWLNHMTMAD